MITLETANKALRDVYLAVAGNQLNVNIDPVLTKIKQTTSSVYGNEILVPVYINGKSYTLKSKLANIYAKLEISDKAIRCSQNSAGAFVNLLNDEMENLIKLTSMHILNAFYSEDKPHQYMSEEEKNNYQPLIFNGLKYLFDDNEELLYGVNREEIKPVTKTINKFDDASIQQLIDDYNEDVNFIICSPKTKRDYMEYLNKNRRIIDLLEFEGGFKCIKFNGIIPISTNRNIPDNELYLINTEDFKLHQLCDWTWIEGEDKSILRQVPSLPKYSAQLVKYANYICDQPNKQIKVIVKNEHTSDKDTETT